MVFYQDVNLRFAGLIVRRFFTFHHEQPKINPFFWYGADVELMLGLKKDTLLNEVFTKVPGKGGIVSIIGTYLKCDLNAFWNVGEVFDETDYFTEYFGRKNGGMTNVSLDWKEVLINSELLKIMIDSCKYEIAPELKLWIEENLLREVNCRMIEMDRNQKVPGFWKTLWNKWEMLLSNIVPLLLFKPKTENRKPKTAEAVTDESLLEFAKSLGDNDGEMLDGGKNANL